MHTSSQAIKLFDPKFVANTLRIVRCCPKCLNEYSYKYDLRMGGSHVKSTRPFLLSCGHSMCENCVYQHHQNLICCVCMRPIEVTPNAQQLHNFQVRDVFDMNFFIIGELHHMRFYRRDGSVNNTILASSQNCSSAVQILAEALPIPKCTECEVEQAIGICRQCNVQYCKVCYDSIHMCGKALRRHTLSPLYKSRSYSKDIQLKPTHCRLHNRLKDCYCRKCDLVCCVLCSKADHNHHGCVSLAVENERIKDKIGNVLDSIKLSRESLRKAQKVITVEGHSQ